MSERSGTKSSRLRSAVRTRLRRITWVRRARAALPALIHDFFARTRRLRPDAVVVISDSSATLSQNLDLVLSLLRARHPGLSVRCFLRPGLSTRRGVRQTLSLLASVATATTVLVDDFTPIMYSLRIRTGAQFVQLWHAAGAYKRVGHSREGLPGGPTPGSEVHRNYTWTVASSEATRPCLAEAFGLDQDRVLALGMARADLFFDEAHVAATRAAVRERWQVGQGVVVLVAPTFRGDGQRSAHQPDQGDWLRLAELVGPETELVFRPHPFTRRDGIPAGYIDGSTITDMSSALMAADVLITDYSSSIFEFALLGRPSLLFTPDEKEYRARRSFYFDLDDYAYAGRADTVEELAAALSTVHVDPERLQRFKDRFVSALDGHSTERIVARIEEGMTA